MSERLEDSTGVSESGVPPSQERERSDYNNARFMGLDARPVSTEAEALSAHVAQLVAAWESKTGSRCYQRRGAKQDQYRRSVGRVLGDLVLAINGNSDRWSYRPLSRSAFTQAPVSYRSFRGILNALEALDLVEVVSGFYHRAEGWMHGRATRVRPSIKLLALIRQYGIHQGHVRLHFLRSLPSRPLVLKASSRRRGIMKVSGKQMSFEATERTRRLEDEVHEINEFIEQHELSGGTHRGYRRIFNCGDDSAFDWNKGGRLYSQGEDSYQSLKKAERLRMRIDGDCVAEIDVRASYLTILHARCEVPLDFTRDPYEIEGLPRGVVKAWVTMTLGHSRFHTRWPKVIVDDLEKEGIKLRGQFPLKQTQASVTKAIPMLADWPDMDIDCFELMYLESEAVVKTMLRLERAHGVVCLSVHDSIIVPISRAQLACVVLVEEYARATGASPRLRVNEVEGVLPDWRIGEGG